MEDDDEIQSQPSPAPNGRIAVTVAAAPPPSSNSLTLALPIQNQKTPGSGGGREDCWSEGATAVLIEAWGERYLELSRGNLKQKHWKDVADIVSSREDYSKTPKTDIQCKNRIDTVKKKYKVEKAKIAAGAGPSKWRFYDKLDELIGPTAKMSSATPPPPESSNPYQRVPMGIPVGIRSNSAQFQLPPNRKRPAVDSDDDSEPENSSNSSDGLPPESYKRPREARMANNVGSIRSGLMNKKSDGSGNSMKELTRAILKFGEAYEQAETAKLQQLVEMEKQRMKFAKELELQRMQCFMKTQVELSQLKRRAGNSNNHHHGHGIIGNNNDQPNNNNNSDSSN
ncbi:trihelix transcription factor ENAP1-like [Salvia miltiorrhiza]|uniref:trihelix transcription factor ENAP1-like n=1 Tax=Salvia miltiorrhiza TaxID=226208 RepID=UPI0025AD931A|nr:trihelix transcription factor ENAP1-like [Salvia miltiorrhiza]